MFKALACATLAGITYTSHCTAQQAPRWYGGLSYGVNHANKLQADRTTDVPAVHAHGTSPVWLNASDHVMFSGVLGAEMSSVWSLEAEWAHRSSADETLMARTGPQINVTGRSTGKFSIESVTLNALYHPVSWGIARPYVGLGVGPSWYRQNWHDGLGSFEDTSTSWSWQLLLGTKIALSERWSANLQYQYFRIADPHVRGTTVNGAATSFSTYTLTNGVTSHAIQVGLRYQF